MSAGSYFPFPVKALQIPIPHGGVRMLEVPTVGVRVAPTVVSRKPEEKERVDLLPPSYGYRPRSGSAAARNPERGLPRMRDLTRSGEAPPDLAAFACVMPIATFASLRSAH